MGVRDRFPETSWTLLERAREEGNQGAHAREDFARRYYRPIFEFLLVIVRDSTLAEELTQEFFCRLSEKGRIFGHAEQGHGVFRTYLMSALRNLVIDHQRRVGPKEAKQEHPDQWSGGWDLVTRADLNTAEATFHNAWVQSTLADVLTQVRATCMARGQKAHLDLFEARYLADSQSPPSWQEIGERYGLDQKTARTRAATVARHFRLALRRTLRRQFAPSSVVGGRTAQLTEAAIDKEIEALLAPPKD
jgi:RNA polymerase sigma factor (sigma-70 family)